jgi:hypothetical protein
MKELKKNIKKKFINFNITSQHLGQVIRGNNITRKEFYIKIILKKIQH